MLRAAFLFFALCLILDANSQIRSKVYSITPIERDSVTGNWLFADSLTVDDSTIVKVTTDSDDLLSIMQMTIDWKGYAPETLEFNGAPLVEADPEVNFYRYPNITIRETGERANLNLEQRLKDNCIIINMLYPMRGQGFVLMIHPVQDPDIAIPGS